MSESSALPMKPLGIKSYGSIPHLPGSRLGPGDHHCHDGQAIICTSKARDRHDSITVTEKLDGSNVCVARIDGVIVPLGRAGYPAATSKYEQHHLFFQWAMERQQLFLELLHDGERLCGEWLAQVHSTRYQLFHEPLVVFDVMRGAQRLLTEECRSRCANYLPVPRLISSAGPLAIECAMLVVEVSGHGALDPVEGAVWRVERLGKFDFLAKYVRPDKIDGLYLPEREGAIVSEPLWNWRPAPDVARET